MIFLFGLWHSHHLQLKIIVRMWQAQFVVGAVSLDSYRNGQRSPNFFFFFFFSWSEGAHILVIIQWVFIDYLFPHTAKIIHMWIMCFTVWAYHINHVSLYRQYLQEFVPKWFEESGMVPCLDLFLLTCLELLCFYSVHEKISQKIFYPVNILDKTKRYTKVRTNGQFLVPIKTEIFCHWAIRMNSFGWDDECFEFTPIRLGTVFRFCSNHMLLPLWGEIWYKTISRVPVTLSSFIFSKNKFIRIWTCKIPSGLPLEDHVVSLWTNETDKEPPHAGLTNMLGRLNMIGI